MELFGVYPDYLLFFQAISFLVLAVAAFLTIKPSTDRFSWPYLAVFALLYSFSTLISLLIPLLGSSPPVRIVAGVAALGAFLFLGEFVCRSLKFRSGYYPGRRLWLLPALAVLAAVIFQQPLLWDSMIYLGMGIVLAFGASASFFMAAQRENIVARKWFAAAGAAFLLISLSFGIKMFDGASWQPFLINVSLSRNLTDMLTAILPGAAALAAAFSLTRINIAATPQMPTYLRRKGDMHYFLSLSIVFLIISGGWVFTNYVGKSLIESVHRRVQLDAQLVSEHLGGSFDQTNRLLMFMSSLRSLREVLANPTATVLRDAANYDLAQVRRSYHLLEKAILIDREGNVVAGRDLPGALPAPFDLADPATSEVLLGSRQATIAYDQSRDIPVYIVSFPVRLLNGDVVGALIFEKNIESVEFFLRAHPLAFHLNPEGVIILASQLLLRSRPLWPLPEGAIAATPAKAPYPATSEEPLLSEKPIGNIVFFNEYPHLLTRSFHTWPIHIMTPLTGVVQGRLLAMLPLFLLIAITLVFFIDSVQLLAKSSQLLGAEKRFQIIFNSVPSAIFILDGQNDQIINTNEYVCSWLGYSPPELRKMSLSEIVANRLETRASPSYRTKAGILRDVDELTADILIDDRPSKLVIAHDITELRQTLEELRLAREFSDSVLDIAAAMIIVLDRRGKIVLFNNHSQRVTGWTREEVLGMNWFDLIESNEDKASLLDIFEKSSTGQVSREYENSIITKQGSKRLVSWKNTILRDSSGAVTMLIATGVDITEQRQNEDNLTRLSLVDSLTGIANRRSFDDFFHRQWKLAAREGKVISLIMGDIDFFKNYNDSLGHPAGDICLVKIAGILKETAGRPLDLVARYGGEEFAVILPDTDRDGAVRVASEIRQRLAEIKLPHPASTIAEFVTISLGVASAVPGPGITADTLIATADQALYQAKAKGRDRIERV